jgi:gamma-glutamyltranspeptidase
MRRTLKRITQRTWTVTIHHHHEADQQAYAFREQVRADTDTEAVMVAMLRTSAERATMRTRVVQIDVG